MRMGWATDLHLDHAAASHLNAFVRQVNEAELDWLLVTGDISNGRSLRHHLKMLGELLDVHVGILLGNHDFYGSSFEEIESSMDTWVLEARLSYHHKALTIPFSRAGTCIVGHNGWADGTAGHASRSRVELNDYSHISNFVGLSMVARFELMRQRAEQCAADLGELLEKAIETKSRHIFIATHVPPFAEAAWHEGNPSDPEWVPHFSAPLVGSAIRCFAEEYPERDFIVVCGHTHGAGVYRPLANLVVYTGGAQYGCPELQAVFEDGQLVEPCRDLGEALSRQG